MRAHCVTLLRSKSQDKPANQSYQGTSLTAVDTDWPITNEDGAVEMESSGARELDKTAVGTLVERCAVCGVTGKTAVSAWFREYRNRMSHGDYDPCERVK